MERCPQLRFGPSKWVCMEVFNINNDRGVFSIPRLKPRALKTPRSLFILNTSIQTQFDGLRQSRGHLSNGKLNFLICKRLKKYLLCDNTKVRSRDLILHIFLVCMCVNTVSIARKSVSVGVRTSCKHNYGIPQLYKNNIFVKKVKKHFWKFYFLTIYISGKWICPTIILNFYSAVISRFWEINNQNGNW